MVQGFQLRYERIVNTVIDTVEIKNTFHHQQNVIASSIDMLTV